MTRILYHAAAAMLAAQLTAFASAAFAAPDPINKCKTITQSGSYIVTKNLTAAGDCLVIQAHFVTIDLDGFTLTGDATGNGISDNVGNHHGVTVRNGTVTNFVSAWALEP